MKIMKFKFIKRVLNVNFEYQSYIVFINFQTSLIRQVLGAALWYSICWNVLIIKNMT